MNINEREKERERARKKGFNFNEFAANIYYLNKLIIEYLFHFDCGWSSALIDLIEKE